MESYSVSIAGGGDIAVDILGPGEAEILVTVAEQGPPGPPGTSSGSVELYSAGAVLGGHRIVIVDAGLARYADASNVSHAHRVVGMTIGAVDAGMPAQVQTGGLITEPSWTWTPDQPLYLREAGQIGHTPPTSGFVLSVGFAVSATQIFLNVGEPTLLL
jgi:hypothetical protein